MTLNIHQNIKQKLDYFYEIHKIPNIIFHGPTGSGKRSIVNEFINKIYENDQEKIKSFVMYVNCSHGKGIKFIREELKFFAKTHINSNGGSNFKSIVLLNADKLTIDAQSALRRCIELFSHNTRFFIVAEDKYNLMKPILSRFCEIYVSEPELGGENINLYKYNINSVFKMKDIKLQRLDLLKKELLKSIPAVYYNDIDENEKIIVDKCRSWTVIDNINLLKENIDKNIKIRMLERPILEIINSFHRLFIKNYRLNDLNMLLVPDSEPVMRPLNGLIYAKQNNQSNNFLFITYKELTENTEETIKKIYDFCNWEYFEHDFNNIVPKYAENDEEYGLEGFHYVYPSIRNVKNEIILPEDIKEKCIDFDDILNNVNFLYKN
jgi:DNA polymerase III delta prime subunit